MDFEARVAGEEAEVIRSMEPFVAGRLRHLVGLEERKWWPYQFFDFMENDDEYPKKLADLREEAKSLRDEELVVLIGNQITEEALPNYSRALGNLFPDPTGVSQNPWNVWDRGWTSEEGMHEKVLICYSLLNGRVSQRAVEWSSTSLKAGGMEIKPGLFLGLVYPAYQEPATATSHMNLARIARRRGVQTLYDICSNIAGDESRHAKFYSDIVAELMRRAPERMMIAYNELTKDGAVMPGRNMTDETYTEPPTLFEHFAGVADRIGVYTTAHHADIFEKLNKTFKVGEVLGLRDEAAEAQERLCKLPDRLREYSDRKKKRHRVAEPVAFDWIYGRAA